MKTHLPCKILSVDWDYFFPDLAPFDWGHQESDLFIHELWSFRTHTRSYRTKKKAIDTVVPDPFYRQFWNATIDSRTRVPWMFVISEAHLDIVWLIRMIGSCNIVNFDQHHDLGYSSTKHTKGYIDSACWVPAMLGNGLLKKYELVYPQWRRKYPEVSDPHDVFDNLSQANCIYYSDKKNWVNRSFDIVFVCRSGAWAPPWSDKDWLSFIGGLEAINPIAWKQRTVLRKAGTSRKFDLRQATELAHSMEIAKKEAANLNKKTN
jgi:hypothetical protein